MVSANFLSNANIANPEAFPGVTTTFIVTASNTFCTAIDSIIVFVNPIPQAFAGNDTTVTLNQTVQLHGLDLNNTPNATYSWSPSAGLNDANIATPVATATNDVAYLLTITTGNGCKSVDTINIRVFDKTEIYVPNAFTPNSDGLNDILKVKPVGIAQLKIFKIFDRWGTLVFSTKTLPLAGTDHLKIKLNLWVFTSGLRREYRIMGR